MLKTIMVLPDGTQISSGTGTETAIKSIELAECVNDGTELSLGSTCANMLTVSIISPNGKLTISEGDEIALYREDSAGVRHPAGLYTAQKPERTTANTLKITAFDRVCRLDKDLSQWLVELSDWPYEAYDLARLVCSECGLELANSEIPNGNHLVQRFSASGITGRNIMRWVGQIAGRFCRATADGKIEFAWYTNSPVAISTAASSGLSGAGISFDKYGNVIIQNAQISADYNAGDVEFSGSVESAFFDGDLRISIPEEIKKLSYYMNGLKYSDYSVQPIRKVQIKNSQDDIGTVWPPNILEEVNTYTISGNYLLTANSADDLVPIAESLYEQLKNISYVPCSVSIPAGFDLHAGSIVKVTDKNGVSFDTYVMSKNQKGQRDHIKCTGSKSRSSSSAVNEQSFKSLDGKVLDLQMSVEGLRIENKNTAEKAASLQLSIDGVKTQVQKQDETISGTQKKIATLEQNAESVQISIQAIQSEGVSQVQTDTGYTFGADGLHIGRSDTDMENVLDESGMVVKRAGDVVLQANDDGVTAVDVTVRNYLIMGQHARFEDYQNDKDSQRTACFWI